LLPANGWWGLEPKSIAWFLGSWADAGGSLSLDGADARVSNLISCFGRRLGISGSGRMASPETQNSFCRYWVSGVDSSNLLSSECVLLWLPLLAAGAFRRTGPSWSSNWWIEALVYLLVLVLAGMLWRQRSEKFSEQYAARMGLAEFTLITLVPPSY